MNAVYDKVQLQLLEAQEETHLLRNAPCFVEDLKWADFWVDTAFGHLNNRNATAANIAFGRALPYIHALKVNTVWLTAYNSIEALPMMEKEHA